MSMHGNANSGMMRQKQMSSSNLLVGDRDRMFNESYNQGQSGFVGHNKNNFSGGMVGLVKKGYNKSYKDLRVGNFGTNRIHKSPSNGKFLSNNSMIDHNANYVPNDNNNRPKSPISSSKSIQLIK